MRSNILGRDPSRFRMSCAGLCPLLAVLGLANANAGPVLTQYEIEGSTVVAGVVYDYQATLNLQSYIAGTPLEDSNFQSFVFEETANGGATGVQIGSGVFPSDLSGSIDPASLADTSFAVTGVGAYSGEDFYDTAGVVELVAPQPGLFRCTPSKLVKCKKGRGGFGPTLLKGELFVGAATPPNGGPPVAVSEPDTLMLMFATLAALLVFVSRKRFRILQACLRRGATAR